MNYKSDIMRNNEQLLLHINQLLTLALAVQRALQIREELVTVIKLSLLGGAWSMDLHMESVETAWDKLTAL